MRACLNAVDSHQCRISTLYGNAEEVLIPGLQRFPYEVLAGAASNFRSGGLVLMIGDGGWGMGDGGFMWRGVGHGVQ